MHLSKLDIMFDTSLIWDFTTRKLGLNNLFRNQQSSLLYKNVNDSTSTPQTTDQNFKKTSMLTTGHQKRHKKNKTYSEVHYNRAHPLGSTRVEEN